MLQLLKRRGPAGAYRNVSPQSIQHGSQVGMRQRPRRQQFSPCPGPALAVAEHEGGGAEWYYGVGPPRQNPCSARSGPAVKAALSSCTGIKRGLAETMGHVAMAEKSPKPAAADARSACRRSRHTGSSGSARSACATVSRMVVSALAILPSPLPQDAHPLLRAEGLAFACCVSAGTQSIRSFCNRLQPQGAGAG